MVFFIFHFYSNFNRTFCKQTVDTLIRGRVLYRLILGIHCLPMSHKKEAMLIWFKVVRDPCQKITLLLLKSKSVRVIVPESCF